jgi:hypothetical protein
MMSNHRWISKIIFPQESSHYRERWRFLRCDEHWLCRDGRGVLLHVAFVAQVRFFTMFN